MKLFTSQQIREIDAFTIREEPISSINLMERAAQKCTNWLLKKYPNNTRMLVVCGQGNNGGDGLAITRLLRDNGYAVTCLVANLKPQGSPEFEINHQKLFDVKLVTEQRKIFDFVQYDVIIDALFGSGLTRSIEPPIDSIVESINNSPAQVVSIDTPSGLFCDSANQPDDHVVEADYTLSLETIKRAHLMPMNHRFVGDLVVLPIGLHPKIKNTLQTDFHFIEKSEVKKLIKPRNVFAHKGNFGHSLLVAGSSGKMGAAVLAAKACLRSGTGLLSMHAPQCGIDIIQQSIPEAMVEGNTGEHYLMKPVKFSPDKYTIGIGPGIGQNSETHQLFKDLLMYNQPLIIDADAINILSHHPSWFNDLPENCILTPHPKELERLVGKWKNDFDKIEIVRQFCALYRCTIIIKGAYSCIVEPNGTVTFNSTGNPGMATAGSGDVLTGIITGLVAQGYTTSEACKVGVFIHGLAGDLAAKQVGEISLLATDIINNLGNAYNETIYG
mgnify:CR=1 FL=1